MFFKFLCFLSSAFFDVLNQCVFSFKREDLCLESHQNKIRTECTPEEPVSGAVVGLALVGPGTEVASLLSPIGLHERLCLQHFGWVQGLRFASVVDAAVVSPPIPLSLAGHRHATLVKLTPLEQDVWSQSLVVFEFTFKA